MDPGKCVLEFIKGYSSQNSLSLVAAQIICVDEAHPESPI